MVVGDGQDRAGAGSGEGQEQQCRVHEPWGCPGQSLCKPMSGALLALLLLSGFTVSNA